jgi:hypothetical protein
MADYNDIRTRFEMAMNESKNLYSQDLAKQVRDLLLKNKVRGNKVQKLDELRFGISGDSKETIKFLSDKVLNSGKIDRDYTLTFEAPDRAKKGDAKSGSFNTYKITIINPFKVGKYKTKPGDIVYIIDNLKARSNIQNKMLTPDGLGLGGKEFKTVDGVRKVVEQALLKLVDNGSISGAHKQFMLHLIDNLRKISKQYNSITEIAAGSEDKLFFEGDFDQVISDPDVAKIAKDYGEILGGIYMMQLTGSAGQGLSFPEAANEPLVDFYIDGQGLSMKAGQGASASLSNVAKLIEQDPKKWEKLMSTENEKLMLQVVRLFGSESAFMGMFKVAELIQCPGWNYLKELLDQSNLSSKQLDPKSLTQWVREYFTNDPDEAYEKFSTYFNRLNKRPDGWENKELQIQDAIQRKEGHGLIFSPLAYHVKDTLNDNELLIDALASVIQKFDVLQLYIDLSINTKKKYQKYLLKKFAEGRFKFNATPSVNMPTRNKFSFKMIKK